MSAQTDGTVLIVDDDAKLRFVLAASLRAAGYNPIEACNGREGVELARMHRPDVIIMDVSMPVMDGLAATRELKSDEATASIPIIMLTARTRTEDLVIGLEVGAQEYLSKPFDVTELLARVRTVFRLARARRDLDQANDRLEEEVKVKTSRLETLYNFMRDLTHAQSRDDILDLIIACVQKTTDARRISLMTTDASGENLRCERAVGIEPEIAEKIRIKSAEGIAGQVFNTGKTMVAQALGPGSRDQRMYGRDAFMSTPLLSAALETSDAVLGVLNLTDKVGDGVFLAEEIECIRSIADAAAIALHNMLRRNRLEQSVHVLVETVGLLAEYRDEETTLHLKRVSKLVGVLARELTREGGHKGSFDEEAIALLVQAAPLHDIGKVGIPDEILVKPGKLTDEEFQIMKTHTDIGRRVLAGAIDPQNPVPLLQLCVDIAYSHHERYNGTGYPRRIAADEIPLPARLISLVDAYDAITSHRRYSPAKSHETAVEIIRSESGKHFDPVIVEAFLRCHRDFDDIRARHAERVDGAQEPVEV